MIMGVPVAVGLEQQVLVAAQIDLSQLVEMLRRFGLQVVMVPDGTVIPGSYWGEREAGLIGDRLYLRTDTPLQSVLHEACHYICMDSARRAALHRDAGGDYDEENAVCYLQILLADYIPGFGRERMFTDMDSWGYTFRLGSARAWFEREADEARQWLFASDLIDALQVPTWNCRR